MRGPLAIALTVALVACDAGDGGRRQDPTARLAAGREALARGDAATAVDELVAAVADLPAAANDLAVAAKEAGKVPQALAAVETALVGHADDPDLLFVTASLRMDVERLGAAEQALRRALTLSPAHTPSLLLMSQLLVGGNRAREARDLLAARESEVCAAGRRPGASPFDRHRVALFQKHLGMALLVLQEAKGATERFEESVALEPGYAEAHYGLGLARILAGDLEAAAAALARARELEPSHVEATYQAANVAERLGRSEEAAEALARFAELYRARLAREAGNR